MSCSGRMNLRLASSYREDDRRRAAGWRLRHVTTTAAAPPAAASPQSTQPAVRFALAAIRRLALRLA